MAGYAYVLHEEAKEIWEKSHRHPFLTELGAGTLDPQRFAYYMKQDYVYLIDYARIFAWGSIKAKDLPTQGLFAKLLDNTLNVEMGLHRSYAEKFGVTREELEETVPAPTTVAYTKYLLDAASTGSLAELAAVLLPCMWSYWEIGTRLKEIPGAVEHPLYGEWIQMYASEEFGEVARWCIELMDRLAEGLPERERKRLSERFLTASRFEYLFWEMAYRQEEWPI